MGLFLPFVDANAGRETYASGRYLEPEEGVANRLWVDFNFAYNPFCAYSEHYVSPDHPTRKPLVKLCHSRRGKDSHWRMGQRRLTHVGLKFAPKMHSLQGALIQV
ncbi:MAG UNVERIFIED_CONTAM: DUF1684 domain-containing protein [Anaerolineae bacterium]|jgi:hypothetical protein